MTIQASLKTKCNHKLKEVLRFKQKPNGEVPFKVTEGKYERIYLQCQNCGHWFSSHSLDLTDLYKEDYVSSTYGGIEGMKKRFDKIMSVYCCLYRKEKSYSRKYTSFNSGWNNIFYNSNF